MKLKTERVKREIRLNEVKNQEKKALIFKKKFEEKQLEALELRKSYDRRRIINQQMNLRGSVTSKQSSQDVRFTLPSLANGSRKQNRNN
jgi:hypothetical protein